MCQALLVRESWGGNRPMLPHPYDTLASSDGELIVSDSEHTHPRAPLIYIIYVSN